MRSPKALSRSAGILYLMVILGMLFNEFIVREQLIAWNNAKATAELLLANEGLFRLGFVVDLLAEASALLLALVLYQLLKPVHSFYALVMLCSIIVTVSVKSLNMLNEYTAIIMLKQSSGYLGAFSDEQVYGQVMLSLAKYSTGFDIAYIYFSFWLLPLGYLILKSGSGRFAKFLGWWLMITFVALFFNFLARFLYPGFHRQLIFYVTGAIDSSEIVLCFWLLLGGLQRRIGS